MSSDLAETRQRAVEAERKKDWEQASRLRDAIALQSPVAGFRERFFAVRAALHVGRIGAADRLRLLVVAAGSEALWGMTRAEIEERRGRDAYAIGWWRKAVALQAEPYWALFGLARSLWRVGKAAEARQAIARALTLGAAEVEGAKFAATLDVQGGNLEQADAKLSAFGVTGDARSFTILAGFAGMTSPAERWALFDAARNLRGVGQALDLGSWLGSLSVSMALGLEANPRARATGVSVHAYDAFIWLAPSMDGQWAAGLPLTRPADGQSFLPLFQHVVRPWAHLIETHPGDLAEAHWTGGAIELLSVDAMKSAELAGHIMTEFYPSLVPGTSLLFHQDFCHGYTWWIHTHHFLLRRHFELIDDVEGSAGVLFRFVQPFEEGELARVAAADLSDPALAADAFSYSMELVAPTDRPTIAAAHIRCELAHGRTERARALMTQYRDDPVADRELTGLPEWAAFRSQAAPTQA